MLEGAPHLALSPQVFHPRPNSCLPIKERRSQLTLRHKIFIGKPTWISPLVECSYNLILHQRMFYEESMRFKSINIPMIEGLLSYNSVISYLEGIYQLRIYKSKLAQFYVNLRYQKDGTPLLISIINQKFFTLSIEVLSHQMNLPNTKVVL